MNDQEIKELFEKFGGKNGSINEEQFVQGMINYFDVQEGYENDFKTMFNLLDKKNFLKKKNGKVDEKEFHKLGKILPKIENLEESKQKAIGRIFFRVIDSDGNGTICEKEMRSFLSESGVTDKKEVKDFMEKLDKNDDGVIQINEFLQWYGCD